MIILGNANIKKRENLFALINGEKILIENFTKITNETFRKLEKNKYSFFNFENVNKDHINFLFENSAFILEKYLFLIAKKFIVFLESMSSGKEVEMICEIKYKYFQRNRKSTFNDIFVIFPSTYIESKNKIPFVIENTKDTGFFYTQTLITDLKKKNTFLFENDYKFNIKYFSNYNFKINFFHNLFQEVAILDANSKKLLNKIYKWNKNNVFFHENDYISKKENFALDNIDLFNQIRDYIVKNFKMKFKIKEPFNDNFNLKNYFLLIDSILQKWGINENSD